MIEPRYQSERVTLYCGDCLDVLPQLKGVDAVITDPPYGLQENAHRVASRTKLAATVDYGDFTWDAKPASQEEIAATRSIGGEHIIWGGNYFGLPASRGWLVWDKLNSGNFADCELAWTDLPMSVRIFRHRWNGMIRASERDVQRVHPAQKPIKLMAWCLGWIHGNLIADPFMGSGSVGIAAMQLGRRFIGIEIDEHYYQVAERRIRDAESQLLLPEVRQ